MRHNIYYPPKLLGGVLILNERKKKKRFKETAVGHQNTPHGGGLTIQIDIVPITKLETAVHSSLAVIDKYSFASL